MGWSKRLMLSASLATLSFFLLFQNEISASSGDKVIPMGHSIGIQMDLSGIFVTNDVLVNNEQWLKAGDTIIRLNGTDIISLNDFEKFVSKTKVEKIHMHIGRKGASVEVMAERDAVKRLLP